MNDKIHPHDYVHDQSDEAVCVCGRPEVSVHHIASDKPALNEEGIEALRADDARRAQFAGKRVRFVRTIVYEGQFEDVERTLAHSLQVGLHEMSPTHKPNGHTIRVVQGPMKVIE